MLPGRAVSHVFVEIGEGDGVLGRLFVVGHAGVLEPVPPQDLVRQVGGTHLTHINYLCTYDLYLPVRNAFDTGSIHYEGKWEGLPPPPPPHRYRLLDGTIKKSTAPYKVHNISLLYIKYLNFRK
jgi:hypothetical protein